MRDEMNLWKKACKTKCVWLKSSAAVKQSRSVFAEYPLIYVNFIQLFCASISINYLLKKSRLFTLCSVVNLLRNTYKSR